MMVDEVYKRLDTLIEHAGGLRKWAKAHDFSPGFVSQVKAKKSPFSERFLREMGLRKNPDDFDVIPEYEDITN